MRWGGRNHRFSRAIGEGQGQTSLPPSKTAAKEMGNKAGAGQRTAPGGSATLGTPGSAPLGAGSYGPAPQLALASGSLQQAMWP
jgi:hypothetical protein